VQRARIGIAVRQAADVVTEGMPQGWQATIRAASVARLGDLADALDESVKKTDLAAERTPRWWSGVRVVQWVLLLGAVIGAGWLVALAGISYLGLPQPSNPRWLSVPAPTWLLVGGLALGFAVALISRALGSVAARRRAGRAGARLRSSVADVVDELVVRPVEVEVDAYRACRAGLAAALTG